MLFPNHASPKPAAKKMNPPRIEPIPIRLYNRVFCTSTICFLPFVFDPTVRPVTRRRFIVTGSTGLVGPSFSHCPMSRAESPSFFPYPLPWVHVNYGRRNNNYRTRDDDLCRRGRDRAARATAYILHFSILIICFSFTSYACFH